eukprot:CAMPEP_0178447244 /NCGR_PEP_ID=MMETSP0689_2-20121128/41274_1 /TAXON_ID=160604 /ORGANISM="Amphidinium massartii, Strain CS-259" /LENGTH=41 /DNA_ID= /DNA_START= /DNA_END= /DNA_ORIENTATION=
MTMSFACADTSAASPAAPSAASSAAAGIEQQIHTAHFCCCW